MCHNNANIIDGMMPKVLHLVEYFPSFAKDMHQLSCLHLRNASGEVIKDLTWPFFCVSIGFTKHAIQTFRSGALNKECNKKQDILSVLHEYHRACFSAFSRYNNLPLISFDIQTSNYSIFLYDCVNLVI